MYTKPSLYYNMIIGKHYKCAFQMVNHIPGEGKLSRPDLFATLIKNYHSNDNMLKLNLDFYPHTYRLYVKEECESYFNLINDQSFRDLLKNQVYFIRKEIIDKKETKLTYFEDHNLNDLYKKGQMCGKRMRRTRDIIQKYVSDQLLYEGKYKFRLRSYMFVASFDPLVAFYHEGNMLLEIEDSLYLDSVVDFQALKDDLIQRKIVNNTEQFNSKIIDQIKHIVRASLYLAKDHFLRDPRGFQLFAFDMIVDSNLKVWLIDIKNNPYLQLKNKQMVTEMLDYVFKLNEMRSSKLYDVFHKMYAGIVSMVKEGTLNMEDHQLFVTGLKNHFLFKRQRDQVRAAMRYFGDYLNHHSNFELIYDGRIGYDLLSTPALELERFQLKLKYSSTPKI